MFENEKTYGRKILIGNVLDSSSMEFFPGFVETEGKKIRTVGRGGELPDTAGAVILEEKNGYILPGLIESHNHLYMDPGPFAVVTRRPDTELLKSMLKNAQIQLHDGVTAQRDCGTPNFLDQEVKDMIEKGIIDGPKLLTCGPWITATHGHGAWPGYAILADGEEECRRAVRTVVRNHVDFVKLFITGGTASTFAPPDFCYYTEREVQVLVEEAKRNQMPVCVHIHGGKGVEYAVKAGVDSLEHCSMITDDAQIEMIAKHGVMMMFNNGVRFAPPNPLLPKFELERVARTRESSIIAVQKALAAGIDIGVGADGYQEDYSLVWALEAFVKSGANTRQALTAASKTPGKRLFGGSRGVLAADQFADIIITAEDPLKNISNLRSIHTVIREGKIVRRDSLAPYENI